MALQVKGIQAKYMDKHLMMLAYQADYLEGPNDYWAIKAVIGH